MKWVEASPFCAKKYQSRATLKPQLLAQVLGDAEGLGASQMAQGRAGPRIFCLSTVGPIGCPQLDVLKARLSFEALLKSAPHAAIALFFAFPLCPAPSTTAR